MGNETSKMIEEEKSNWVADHILGIDVELRETQLPLIERFGSPLKLCNLRCRMIGMEFFHFFITDGKWTMEFGGCRLSQNTVLIHPNPYQSEKYMVQKQFQMTQEVKERMMTVCGASAYSLCLRNCEHLARYIQSGSWYSLQMAGESAMRKVFIKHMMQRNQAMVNTPPSDIKPMASEGSSGEVRTVYPDWNSPYAPSFSRPLQTLSGVDEHARVIVVLGPTGAGKSTLVNLLFNRRICTAKTSPMSVTKHMDILSGSVEVPNSRGLTIHRSVRVIDTIGFCDSVIPPDEVVAIVKSFVKSNVQFVDKVVIVCSGRLESTHAVAIQDFMKWLKYKKHQQNFVFIYNKAEDLTEGDKTEAIGTMCDLLGADPAYSRIHPTGDGSCDEFTYAFATGFPPRAPLSEVQPDLTQLHNAVLGFRADEKRMRVDESWCSIL